MEGYSLSGQIIKRGNSKYLVRIFLGRDREGKKKYYSKTFHGNKREAEKFKNKILRERDLGELNKPATVYFEDYLSDWLENHVRRNVRFNTFKSYQETINKYILPTIGGRSLSDITTEEINNIYVKLSAKGLSSRTVRYVHTIFNKSLNDAIKKGILKNNPAKGVWLPKNSKPEIIVLTEKEVKLFLKTAKGNFYFPLFYLMAFSGIRPSEARALKWNDINFEKGQMSIRRVIDVNCDGGFQPPKSKKGQRNIFLIDRIQKHLKQHQSQQKKMFEEKENLINLHNLVFTNKEGGIIKHRNLVRRNFKPLLQKAQVRDISLYQLRHTFASILLSKGVHPKVVSEILGHSSIVITLDTYSHVLPNIQREALEKLDEL